MDKNFNIAIDGPAGAGKGITSKLLSEKLGFKYLDTGAMYRAVSYYFNLRGVMPEDIKKEDFLDIEISFDDKNHIILNGLDVEEKIRTPQIGEFVSSYAQIRLVRNFLTKMQKEIVKDRGFVAEGRDIGYAVMPDAKLKIYLTASSDQRAKRRVLDFKRKGIDVDFDKIKEDIIRRDELDMANPISPLKKLDDAIEIDTTNLTVEEQVDKIYNLIN